MNSIVFLAAIEFTNDRKALLIYSSNGMTEMKTPNLQKHFKPTILAAAIFGFGFSFTTQAATVPISNIPLSGVTIKHGPNITLTPSVEHPTAGAAYSNNEFIDDGYPTLIIGSSQAERQNQWKRYYLGYFDNTKCYTFKEYGSTNGYFEVSSRASTDAAGNVGLCPGNTDEYSGNFLNWATMSAVDIFRYSLTGGNRARGMGNDPTNYEAGDTTSSTFLRRAYVNPRQQQNGQQHFRLRLRAIHIASPTAANFMFLKRIIPASMVDSFATTSDAVGLPRALGFRYYASPIPGKPSLQSPQQQPQVAASEKIGRPNKIFFVNESFFVTPVRMNRDGALMYQDRDIINPLIAPGATKSIVNVAKNASLGKDNLTNFWLPVVVKACDPGTSGASSLPSNCRQYGSVYKPEGLMQKYGRGSGPDSRPARFSVFGYQLAHTNDVSGGVLRARMKYLDRTQTENNITYGREWDERTGVLAVNPDSDDAKQTGVTNSGAINYINKFGDAGNYKGYDTAAELFYTAQRYLRHKGMPAYYEQTQRQFGINPRSADGFPMIYNWDDPLTRGLASPDEAQCRSNTMILIGDTFTHDEKDLPNFIPSSGVKDDPEIKTQEILSKILDQERFKGLGGSTWDWSRGSGGKNRIPYSPAGIVALAYWGRTQDIRTDITGNQHINTFMIDVLENGKGRFEQNDENSIGNAYYWAAKYGGFNYAPDDPKNPVVMPNDSRGSWTADAPGVSSSPILFPEGMPRNFALGNSPENMMQALEDAFKKANEYTDPSQAFVGVTEHQNETLKIGNSLGLQSSYNVDELSGDVITQRIGLQGNGLTFTPAWRASSKLEVFHTATGWGSRKLFTESTSGSTVQFTPGNAAAFSSAMNAGASANSLIQYTLGDPSLEGSAWRKRERGLLGTIINSGVQPILPPQQKPNGCEYANRNITVRPNFYATASNAGVLHILNQDGGEVMGYIPSTALPKLYSLSLRTDNPQHQYLNDGTPVTGEVCFGNTAKSIVVGSAGRGGASVYALDVTDLSNPSASNVLWEFSNADDPDLGLTVGKPTIAKDKDNNPIVIFSSGVNSNSNSGYLYILRADNNSGVWQLNRNYWKVPLGQEGVGEPTIYDQNGDDIPEAVFVGDLSGKMWRVNYDATSSTWAKAYNNQPLYTPSGTGSPITAAPTVVQTGGHLYVIAGTGQYFSLNDVAPGVQNYALGLFAEQGPISDNDLLGQSIGSSEDVDAIYSTNKNLQQKLYQITRNALQSHHKGWRLKLLSGQAIVSQPGVRANRVATFTAVRSLPNSTNVCKANGATALIAVDLQTGGQYNLPAFDTNKDGRFDGADKLGGMLEVGGIMAPVGTAKEAVVAGQRSIRNILAGDTGLMEAPTNTFETALIRRISWREIFD
ncbi:pilus assembly protein [Eikenella longinqua]|nr:PilC/PilY family type IV pilus protein [Eikenella longinqua]